jgi:hypothetical protein
MLKVKYSHIGGAARIPSCRSNIIILDYPDYLDNHDDDIGQERV